jgi:uncharacterized repeat protein (TIGR01451 family)
MRCTGRTFNACLRVGFVLLPLLSLINFAPAQTCEPPAGLVNWWPADGHARDTVSSDDGTPQNGATFAPGLVGQAFSFDGVDDYVQLPDNFFPYPPDADTSNRPFTFDAWFKTNAGGVIFGQQSVDPFTPDLSPFEDGWVPAVYVGTDGLLYAQMFWTGGTAPLASQSPVNDGIFHHVAITYDGVMQTLYLDGVAIGNANHTQLAYAQNYYHYQFGTGYTHVWPGGNGGWYSFRGLLDEVEIFDRALSPSEIQAIYDCKRPAGADLSITKADAPDPVKVRGTLTYALTVTNHGPASPATGVTVTDTLPGSVTVVSASASQGSCSETAGTVTCPLGDLADGATATVTITVTPTATGTLTNTASVHGNEADPNGTNDSDTESTVVTRAGKPFQLTVMVRGKGVVTSTPPGIDCPSDCTEAYSNGTVVQLTAAATNAQYRFDHWQGGCTGTTTSCAVTITSNLTVKAIFKRQ